VFTDMQRADTIRALGNDVIRTPHLDRLVREGTAFTNCFTPSPVCVPARCCMHYGMYPQRTGLFANGRMMDDNGMSYPALLGRHGYRTHAIGKCHFTKDHKALRGFHSRLLQEECKSDPAMDDYVAWLKDNNFDSYEPHGARGEMYYIPQISSLPQEAHPTQWIGDNTVRFVNDAAAQSQPWCLFSSFIHPHPPLAPPKPWHKLYRLPEMPLPLTSGHDAELLTWINRLQNRYKYRDHGSDLNLVRMIKAYYYACISFVDYQVGRILESLEQTGQLDNTMIIFTSDHGEHLGDLGCFGKRSMHDPSARVPLLVRYPDRFPAGKTCKTATSLCDVFPTILSACGADHAGLELDGLDLHDIVNNPDPDRVVYSQFARGDGGIYLAATARWKYVYSAGDGQEFFFDRQADPAEINNLVESDEVAADKLKIKCNLLEYLKRSGMDDAWEDRGGMLEWRAYPRKDESYLDDPDARLLVQDYAGVPLDLPGYTTQEG
ncbi:MAG: sulfatase-like hydrolase/transferase, partial [Lentisphaerae bacterium]|nr:sulfatase-like hydrolase/transferase [Lentisphaerota bacterium]